MNSTEPQVDPKSKPEKRSILTTKIIEIGEILHRYSLWMLIAALIGTSVGVKASQFYYNGKMKEATLVGGIVFQGEIFSIIKK